MRIFLFRWAKIWATASCTLGMAVADSSSSSGKSRMSWLYFCTLSMASLRPVSAVKLTVAWKRLACLRISRVRATPSLRSWASMLSSADSMDSQKLISWLAVPVVGSRVILVMTWMDLIQLLTVACRLLRKVLSCRRAAGIRSMVGRAPREAASSRACCTTGWKGSATSGISTFCCRWDRLSSSSVKRFLVTGMPVLASTSARPRVALPPPPPPLAICWWWWWLLLVLASK
ncbi:hypothetical protein VTK73DRAFT_3622 [Phialemonium thermophilum]|uniref:Secreted protein n=1 Tax=Phialemonium thermophilum TaxID=223376 RepID=A0ABR3VGY5_9PEZI